MNTSKLKQNLAPGIWGAIAGAVVVAVVGFNWAGWVTGSTASEMASAAVEERLVPICVGQFNADSDRAAKLAEMNKVDSWKRSEYVIAQGWATMPGANEPDAGIARECAREIQG